jgi:hypothetical protein
LITRKITIVNVGIKIGIGQFWANCEPTGSNCGITSEEMQAEMIFLECINHLSQIVNLLISIFIIENEIRVPKIQHQVQNTRN